MIELSDVLQSALYSMCTRHDFLYIRGWMQMAFYYHMIYSPETDRQVRHCSWLQSLRLQQINTYNDTYSVHDEALMPRRARLLCLLASCERLSIFTVGYQLLIFSPTRRAGSPFSPCIHSDPISPRDHAHPRPFVCYSMHNQCEMYNQWAFGHCFYCLKSDNILFFIVNFNEFDSRNKKKKFKRKNF